MMKNKIEPKDFRVRPGRKVDLKRWPTGKEPIYTSKKHYRKHLLQQVKELSALQRLH